MTPRQEQRLRTKASICEDLANDLDDLVDQVNEAGDRLDNIISALKKTLKENGFSLRTEGPILKSLHKASNLFTQVADDIYWAKNDSEDTATDIHDYLDELEERNQ